MKHTHQNHIRFRIFTDRIFRIIIFAISFLATVPLILILFHLIRNGISALNWQFLVNLPKPIGETGGGISNAIVGTLMLIGIASLFSIPPGILAGIYLSEHKGNRLSYWLTLSAEILQGIPSIVIGIIAYVWIVSTTGQFSAVSGGIALGIMMLPLIIKATEETLLLIPVSLKEASLALGVPYYKTILRVILPAGISGIATGILLGVARIGGETAPLLFTAFGNPFMNYNILKPINSLPLLIFNYAKSPYPEWLQLAWGASLVLIIMVLLLNLSARLVTRRWKVQF